MVRFFIKDDFLKVLNEFHERGIINATRLNPDLGCFFLKVVALESSTSNL